MKRIILLSLFLILLFGCSSNKEETDTPLTVDLEIPEDIISGEELQMLEQNTKESETCQNMVESGLVDIEGQIVAKEGFKYAGDLELFTYLGIKTADDCIFFFLIKSEAMGNRNFYNEEITKTIGDNIKLGGNIRPVTQIGGEIEFYAIHNPEEIV